MCGMHKNCHKIAFTPRPHSTLVYHKNIIIILNNKKSSFVTKQKAGEAIKSHWTISPRNDNHNWNWHAIEQSDRNNNFTFTSFFYLNLIVNEPDDNGAMTLLIAVDFRWWINLLFQSVEQKEFNYCRVRRKESLDDVSIIEPNAD